MNLTDIREELAERLNAITDLRGYSWVNSPVSPPAALVMLPTQIQYDQTFVRGGDRIELDVLVVAGRADERSAYNRISDYAAGSGGESIKLSLDGNDYTSCDEVTVTTGTFGVATIGGVDYLAATFTLDIVGTGS